MNRKPDSYASWTETVLKTRTLGWMGNWLIWGVIALVLLVFSLFELPVSGLPLFAALFSTPPVTFIAHDDISAFTILTPKNVDLMPPGTQASDEIKQQEVKVYEHITLRAYEKGEEIQSKDLGPKLPANHTYQIREINASASTAWMQAGDILMFALANANCSAGVTSTPTCPSQAGSRASLQDTVIVQVGKVGQNGLLALLVAIPLEENTRALAFLDAGGSAVVAYPLTTLTPFSSLPHPLNGRSLASSSASRMRS